MKQAEWDLTAKLAIERADRAEAERDGAMAAAMELGKLLHDAHRRLALVGDLANDWRIYEFELRQQLVDLSEGAGELHS